MTKEDIRRALIDLGLPRMGEATSVIAELPAMKELLRKDRVLWDVGEHPGWTNSRGIYYLGAESLSDSLAMIAAIQEGRKVAMTAIFRQMEKDFHVRAGSRDPRQWRVVFLEKWGLRETVEEMMDESEDEEGRQETLSGATIHMDSIYLFKEVDNGR